MLFFPSIIMFERLFQCNSRHLLCIRDISNSSEREKESSVRLTPVITLDCLVQWQVLQDVKTSCACQRPVRGLVRRDNKHWHKWIILKLVGSCASSKLIWRAASLMRPTVDIIVSYFGATVLMFSVLLLWTFRQRRTGSRVLLRLWLFLCVE